MISILVPIFNFDVVELVSELSNQARTANIPFEILCYDDESIQFYKNCNEKLGDIEGVTYKQLDQNIGRSAIRNLLAQDAQYSYLLYLDCDSQIQSSTYLQWYLDAIKPGLCICGGRVYAKKTPREPDLQLRWSVGTGREVFSAEERSHTPYKSFMTNNFLIPRDVFQSIKMDESLTQYGHEDTLFGAELKKQGIPILHLDNALCHIGLETTPEFLQKTRQSLENLHKLIERGQVDNDIKIFRYYTVAKRWGLKPWLVWKFKRNRHKTEKILATANPSLRKFDLYKIGYLLSLDS